MDGWQSQSVSQLSVPNLDLSIAVAADNPGHVALHFLPTSVDADATLHAVVVLVVEEDPVAEARNPAGQLARESIKKNSYFKNRFLPSPSLV